MSQDTGALGASQGKVGERPVEAIVAKWIDVKVTAFDLRRGVGGVPEDEADEACREKKHQSLICLFGCLYFERKTWRNRNTSRAKRIIR